MKFDIITIFPKIFDSFLKESLIKKAQDRGLVKIGVYDLRKWALDKHKTVDDKPFGGGRGMVVKVEPVYRCVQQVLGKRYKALGKKTKTYHLKPKTLTILFTPRGKKFNQKMAYRFSKLDRLIMICGRYEGVDERVAKYIADIELSIGDYVLMGGELPAMVVIEAVSRLLPGVMGKSELLPERMTKAKGRAGRGFIEYPQYTRPEVFAVPTKALPCRPAGRRAKAGAPKKAYWRTPKILLSGDHKKIKEWRQKHSKVIEK